MKLADTKLQVDDIARLDPAYWTQLHRVRVAGGPFTFERREYQQEPMMSTARRLCYMKATQLGITEIENLKTLHGLIQGRYPKGVLVLFPTDTDMRDFGKSRFDPLIQANPDAIGKYVKPGGKGADTVSLKKVGTSFLYLRGATLSRSMGDATDEKASVKLTSVPVDAVKFEEMDLMDEDTISKAKGRMGDSAVAEEVYISNPSIPDRGIDNVFKLSDQRHWHKKCSRCGKWSCPEETFPDCVALRHDGTGFVRCPKCGADVGPLSGTLGEWVPKVRANSDYMHGYRMSQLMSAARVNDPADILRDFENPPQGNLADVYRLRLGLPYIPATDRLQESAVLSCCGQDIQAVYDSGPCACGVDIGKTFHVVIGIRTAPEAYEILRVLRLPMASGWQELHDLRRKFGIRSFVIDIRPYEDGARKFQAAENARVFLCEYMETAVQGNIWSDATGVVKANRTELCDATHRLISERRLVLPRACDEVRVFADQMTRMAKVLETNKKSGISIYRYVKLSGNDEDHYRHALNYFLLAAERLPVRNRFADDGARQDTAEMEYARV